MKKRGFTLVELMIVIAIISVLATIIIPKMSGARERGKLTACKGNLKQISIAMEMYANDNNHTYPVSSRVKFNTSLCTAGYINATNPPQCPSNNTGLTSYYYNTYPASYLIWCYYGDHSAAGLGAGWPQYNTASGLLEH